jgi:hypothetical protein
MTPERASRKARQSRLHDTYHKFLKQPGLTTEQIEAMRRHVIFLARTICEHVWDKKFY